MAFSITNSALSNPPAYLTDTASSNQEKNSPASENSSPVKPQYTTTLASRVLSMYLPPSAFFQSISSSRSTNANSKSEPSSLERWNIASQPIPINNSNATRNHRASLPSSLSAPSLPKERSIVKIFREIAEDHDLSIQTHSQDWVISFTDRVSNITKRVIGYKLGINEADAMAICDDKAATSAILTEKNIPHIEHKLFNKPGINCGSWEKIKEYAESFNYDLVCKPKDKSSGVGVTRVKNLNELQATCGRLFEKAHDLCISPYHEIQNEYRVVMLLHEPQLLFRKNRPCLVGDGVSTVQTLLSKFIENTEAMQLEKMGELDLHSLPLKKIPTKGEIISLKWKHNLANGAQAELLDLGSEQKTIYIPTGSPPTQVIDFTNSDDDHLTKIQKLAIKATEALGILFCSADIVEMKDHSLKVMEVNSGVMMENFIAQYGDDGYAKAKAIYEKAILHMLKSTSYQYKDSPSLKPRKQEIKLSSSFDERKLGQLHSLDTFSTRTTNSPRSDTSSPRKLESRNSSGSGSELNYNKAELETPAISNEIPTFLMRRSESRVPPEAKIPLRYEPK